MTFTDINDMRVQLEAGQIIEADDEERCIVFFHRKSLRGRWEYFIELNGKIIFSSNRFREFRNKILSMNLTPANA